MSIEHEEKNIECELTVIGAGMAGMVATLFAVNRGLSVAQVGSTSEIGFASGFFDLLGIHPMDSGQRWDDPWAGIDSLVQDIPLHPYAKLKKEEIRGSLDELLVFLENTGLPYAGRNHENVNIVTSMGSVKTTFCVPKSMWPGIEALERKQPCLLVDIKKLKGFSAGLIADTLKKVWPGLKTAHIDFPGSDHQNEIYPEQMANALVIARNREKLAQVIHPHVKGVQAMGIPAVLGLFRTEETISHLTELLGVPIFEIPTMPPSLPGFRLKEAFDRGLREKRSFYFPQKRVLKAVRNRHEEFEFIVGNTVEERKIFSKGVILATGRFTGGGLWADRRQIHETLFDLPLFQPEHRTQWHREDLFDPRGHLINQAGLETDKDFRPLDKNGRPAFFGLYAAGSILAHQDWKRMKCGAGLAAATAFGAVKAFILDFNP